MTRLVLILLVCVAWAAAQTSPVANGTHAEVRSGMNANFSAINTALGQKAAATHASQHQHSGADEIATATPGANAIPKAGSGGTLAAGWIPDLSATYTTPAAVAAAYLTIANAASTYAPIAKGVTNGDSHDHNGGDGAQIDHVNLSNKGTNTHAQIDTFIASKAQANGLASLGADGKVPTAQLPASSSGITSMTTGAADPSANCTAPSASNLSLYTQTTTQDVWACVATNTWKKILSTTNTGAYVATGASGATPSAPATSGDMSLYFDSTRKTAGTIHSDGTISYTVRVWSGTAALGTSAIASGACASAVTVAATGVATTDVISWTPNGDISAVTGYAPVTTGGLIIYPYPTADNINFKVCNPTSGSITPGAVTLNWRVTR